MVVSLHACDTATDHALFYAIEHKARYIFSVPCCQHEINAAIKGKGDFEILLKHGLIKERFSALLTDAVRADALSRQGYAVDCLEFVGPEASPKNLMLRAVLRGGRRTYPQGAKELLDKYNSACTLLKLIETRDRGGGSP